MILISHRGNLYGPDPEKENSPSYIDVALNEGFRVEVDVWIERYWWLGHDKPQYKLPKRMFNYEKGSLIFHCKNSAALQKLSYQGDALHYFWHQEDDYTITSQGKIWVYPGKKLLSNSVCVLPEREYNGSLNVCWGICSDEIGKYRKKYETSSME